MNLKKQLATKKIMLYKYLQLVVGNKEKNTWKIYINRL